MTDKEFSEFLKINGINPANKYALENLVSQLERFVYKLEQTWSIFQSSQQKAITSSLVKNSNDIINRIKTQYAALGIMSDLLQDKNKSSNDKFSMMIYAVAEQMYGVYKKLLQQINTLTPKK